MMVGNIVHGASMRLARAHDGCIPDAGTLLARTQCTSFPRRRAPLGARVARSVCRIGGFTNLGSRLRVNDGSGSNA